MVWVQRDRFTYTIDTNTRNTTFIHEFTLPVMKENFCRFGTKLGNALRTAWRMANFQVYMQQTKTSWHWFPHQKQFLIHPQNYLDVNMSDENMSATQTVETCSWQPGSLADHLTLNQGNHWLCKSGQQISFPLLVSVPCRDEVNLMPGYQGVSRIRKYFIMKVQGK